MKKNERETGHWENDGEKECEESRTEKRESDGEWNKRKYRKKVS